MLNEADTRVKLIDPKLHESGWREEFILRDRPITPGRLIDERGNRKAGKKPDYILLYRPGFPIAVVEAKDEGHSALDGMQQAKGYALDLDVLLLIRLMVMRLRSLILLLICRGVWTGFRRLMSCGGDILNIS